ncbi:GRN protein, partial [Molothrus ater]|nr:GRN protein [Molothrus ater]
PQAVCCPDLVHCCPQGYTCDPEGGSCLKGGGTRRPWVQKTPALPRGGQVTSGNVKCDETTSCPDGSTCCQMSLGTWGCCPFSQVWGAVSNGVHGCVGWGSRGCTQGSGGSWTEQRFQGV